MFVSLQHLKVTSEFDLLSHLVSFLSFCLSNFYSSKLEENELEGVGDILQGLTLCYSMSLLFVTL